MTEAMDLFYKSDLYQMVKDDILDMHCMSDEYFVEELEDELKEKITFLYLQKKFSIQKLFK